MDIAQVAKKSGYSASALRYYEEKGLITPAGRQGLRRTFAPGVLDQLALISLGQAAGFSLDDIGAMFSPDGQASIDRTSLTAKADELDNTIKRLKA
ncbi:MAG: MerR family transcriptional regulator, partial [Polaromonas sp.]|nr:MerR family transcriptional regulator [Polaromonas sp.]